MPPYKLNEAEPGNQGSQWRILTQYHSRFSRTHSSPLRKIWEWFSENRASLPTSRRVEITPALSSTSRDSESLKQSTFQSISHLFHTHCSQLRESPEMTYR